MPRRGKHLLLNLWKNRADPDARRQLAEHLAPIIFATLRGRTMPPGMTIEDMAHETLQHVLSHLDDYDPQRSQLTVFARRMAVLRYTDAWHASNKEPDQIEIDESVTAAPIPPPADPELLGRLKGLLSTREYQVIVAGVMADTPMEVIASVMGVTVQHVRRIRAEALGKLRGAEMLKQINN